MAIEHDSIVDTERHEPKGASTATSGSIYISNGAGSGVWTIPTLGDISDYTDAFGQLKITNNATVIAKTIAVDLTLATNSDYSQVTTVWDATPHGINRNVTQTASGITIDTAGLYEVKLWATMASSVSATAVAFKTAINGTLSAQRTPQGLLRTATEIHSVSASNLVSFNAADVLTLYVATDQTCNLTLRDVNLSVVRLGAL